MCIATRDIMDSMFETRQEPEDISKTNEIVWIIGKQYHARTDVELKTIRKDIISKIWFTYRRNFVPIGGDDGLRSDKGWGCMLRCGQMVLAQALVAIYLGRAWLWESHIKDSVYLNILKKFQDSRKAPFSIHQIALMGVSEGKEVGQWFGPNTIAQVLKKLVAYDEWNSLAVHVALDNTVIIKEIRDLCLSTKNKNLELTDLTWKPLLLIVPLRLGLSEINPVYVSAVQKCFQFEHSVGIIGGRPNLALYFIGYVGNDLICLDPHKTQPAGYIGNKDTEEQVELDESYHCKYATRVPILSMDPSIAVCFLCKVEEDFNKLCNFVKDKLMDSEKQPLFEISVDRPQVWVSSLEESTEGACSGLMENGVDDSDQDFEIL